MEENNTPKKQKNITFIGTRSPVTYVKGITIQFTAKKESEVVVKARGKNISTAVEVCELVKKRFEKEKPVFAKTIEIGSEEMQSRFGKKVLIPTIEILLKKK